MVPNEGFQGDKDSNLARSTCYMELFNGVDICNSFKFDTQDILLALPLRIFIGFIPHVNETI